MKNIKYTYQEAVDMMDKDFFMEYALDVYCKKEGQLYIKVSHKEWKPAELTEDMIKGAWWKHPYVK